MQKFSCLPYLHMSQTIPSNEAQGKDDTVAFSEDDDLDSCLYYLRTLSNVFRWAPDAIWPMLASSTLAIDASRPDLAKISKCTGPKLSGTH